MLMDSFCVQGNNICVEITDLQIIRLPKKKKSIIMITQRIINGEDLSIFMIRSSMQRQQINEAAAAEKPVINRVQHRPYNTLMLCKAIKPTQMRSKIVYRSTRIKNGKNTPRERVMVNHTQKIHTSTKYFFRQRTL